MNCRASIAGFAATSKTLEAYGADEPKAPAFSGISYIQISDPPEFVSKYANDLADDGSEKAPSHNAKQDGPNRQRPRAPMANIPRTCED
jgi:hypothetical protein